jgi:hypothetical protein
LQPRRPEGETALFDKKKKKKNERLPVSDHLVAMVAGLFLGIALGTWILHTF